MNTNQFMDNANAWLPGGSGAGIAISSRVRLARNLRDTLFPGWAGQEECQRVWDELHEQIAACEAMQKAQTLSMGDLSSLDKQVLFERHLISREQAERKEGSGVIIREDGALAVMVNEEDHLRLQCILPGLNIVRAWEEADRLDSQIEADTAYAFSPQLGYLTACPSNVGTGMRASVMLHVPGLVLMNEMGAVVKGMAKIGLAVRGLWGEGSEASGNMFQVSNQMTLGDAEEEIIKNLEHIVLEIIEHERNARWRVLESSEPLLRDRVGRAVGILSNAHVLTSKEALDLLSDLRLGSDMDLVPKEYEQVINDLLILTQPGHLQKLAGKRLKPHERDIVRAQNVRGRIEAALNHTSREKHE
jgi:protein arginine kinase